MTAFTLVACLGIGIVGLVVVLVLAAGGYIFKTSQNAAHQASPTEAVDSFLDASLHEQNLSLAQNYTCGNGAIKSATKTIIDQINAFDQHPGWGIDYYWTDVHQQSRQGDQSTVTANIHTTTTNNKVQTINPVKTWTFAMSNKDGWKVCQLNWS